MIVRVLSFCEVRIAGLLRVPSARIVIVWVDSCVIIIIFRSLMIRIDWRYRHLHIVPLVRSLKSVGKLRSDVCWLNS